MSSRKELLRKVYNKALTEILKTITDEELRIILIGKDRREVDTITKQFKSSIFDNCTQEFESIIAEKSLDQKLDQLDQLVSSSVQLKVDFSAFQFKHRDPETVKQQVSNEMKKQEIERLKSLISGLESENKVLAERESTARAQLSEINSEIIALQSQLSLL